MYYKSDSFYEFSWSSQNKFFLHSVHNIIRYVFFSFGVGVAMSLHYGSYYYDSLTLSFMLRMHVEDMVILSVTPLSVTLVFYGGIRHNKYLITGDSHIVHVSIYCMLVQYST